MFSCEEAARLIRPFPDHGLAQAQAFRGAWFVELEALLAATSERIEVEAQVTAICPLEIEEVDASLESAPDDFQVLAFGNVMRSHRRAEHEDLPFGIGRPHHHVTVISRAHNVADEVMRQSLDHAALSRFAAMAAERAAQCAITVQRMAG